MLKNREIRFERLFATLQDRAEAAGAYDWIRDAEEIVLFGSMAAGVSRPTSDLDVLIVSPITKSLKTKSLDIVGISRKTRESEEWTSSELASHIKRYGVWFRGTSEWTQYAHLGHQAIGIKARRISAFANSLPRSWLKLDEVFKQKYSIKLRRETQRLLLLERQIAIPPTRLLDEDWLTLYGSGSLVLDRLKELTQRPHSSVVDEIASRIEEHFKIVPAV